MALIWMLLLKYRNSQSKRITTEIMNFQLQLLVHHYLSLIETVPRNAFNNILHSSDNKLCKWINHALAKIDIVLVLCWLYSTHDYAKAIKMFKNWYKIYSHCLWVFETAQFTNFYEIRNINSIPICSFERFLAKNTIKGRTTNQNTVGKINLQF